MKVFFTDPRTTRPNIIKFAIRPNGDFSFSKRFLYFLGRFWLIFPFKCFAKLSVVGRCIKLISCSHPTRITPQPPQYYNNETLTRRSIFSPFYPRHSATGGSRARHLTPTGEGWDIHSGGATGDVCLPGFYFVKSPPRGTVLAGRYLSPIGQDWGRGGPYLN